MTTQELSERIKLAWEQPNCIWEFDRHNGFSWWEDDMLYATPGVAVAIAGVDFVDETIQNRHVRGELIGMEWSELMHFEMAINALFNGDGYSYNEIARKITILPIIKPFYSAKIKTLEDAINKLSSQ